MLLVITTRNLSLAVFRVLQVILCTGILITAPITANRPHRMIFVAPFVLWISTALASFNIVFASFSYWFSQRTVKLVDYLLVLLWTVSSGLTIVQALTSQGQDLGTWCSSGYWLKPEWYKIRYGNVREAASPEDGDCAIWQACYSMQFVLLAICMTIAVIRSVPEKHSRRQFMENATSGKETFETSVNESVFV